MAENEAGEEVGDEESFETQNRPGADPCPNAEFRNGFSTALPDCRAYELVTPGDTRGATPYAAGPSSPGETFNNWLTPPRGPGAGESLSFFINGTTLPGFDGNGRNDGYRAARGPGSHPPEGWVSTVFAPSFSEAGGSQPPHNGLASDQLYSFWKVHPPEVFADTLDDGAYLRTESALFEIASRAPPSTLRPVSVSIC